MDPSGIVRFGSLTLAGEKPASGEASVMLAVRPEFVCFSGNPDGILTARVERTEFLGSEVIVHARLGAIGETIVAKISPAEASSLTTGMPVSVEIEPDRAMLFAASGERLRAKTVAAAAALEKAHG